MKFKKGDKIVYAGYGKNAVLEFNLSTDYDLIIGIVDKRYYAIESWFRSSPRSKKYKFNEAFLENIDDFERDIQAEISQGTAKIKRKGAKK